MLFILSIRSAKLKVLPKYSNDTQTQRLWKRAFKVIGKHKAVELLIPLVRVYVTLFDELDDQSQSYLDNRTHIFGTLDELSRASPSAHSDILREIIEHWESYHFTEFASARPVFDLLALYDTNSKFERYALSIISAAERCEIDLSALHEDVSKLAHYNL